MNITVAIPYYNNECYLEQAIKPFLESEFVSEIIIHDDCSETQIKSSNSKIKVYRNDVNLGAFKNKYLAVLKSTNEWIYLLDGDNYFFENSLDVVKSISTQRGRYYSPSQLHLVDDGLDSNLDGKIVKYDFGIIDSVKAKSLLTSGIGEFEWFINTGNFFVNRDDYIDAMKDIFEDDSYPYFEADAIVFCYNWLKNGNTIEIVDDLWYNHRLRSNSYSHSVGNKNAESLDYHKKLMLQL